jgi:hypothetical protein
VGAVARRRVGCEAGQTGVGQRLPLGSDASLRVGIEQQLEADERGARWFHAPKSAPRIPAGAAIGINAEAAPSGPQLRGEARL